MSKLMNFGIIVLSVTVLSSCTNNTTERPSIDDEVVTELPEKDSEKDDELEKIKATINTDLIVKLPTNLLLENNEHLTAETQSDNNNYKVAFYKDDKKTKIAVLDVEKKSSAYDAKEQVAFEEYKQIGGEEVDLGYDIIGYQDAGAGSVFTSWNEGRWALSTRTLTEKSEDGVELSKEAVKFLEKNTLPIPNEYGSIKLDIEGDGNLALWQEGNVLYSLSEVDDPMDLLKILVSFK